jgi:hypothetical protein
VNATAHVSGLVIGLTFAVAFFPATSAITIFAEACYQLLCWVRRMPTTGRMRQLLGAQLVALLLLGAMLLGSHALLGKGTALNFGIFFAFLPGSAFIVVGLLALLGLGVSAAVARWPRMPTKA